jgi:hypothetical protein
LGKRTPAKQRFKHHQKLFLSATRRLTRLNALEHSDPLERASERLKKLLYWNRMQVARWELDSGDLSELARWATKTLDSYSRNVLRSFLKAIGEKDYYFLTKEELGQLVLSRLTTKRLSILEELDSTMKADNPILREYIRRIK